ncbi:MAG TPA: flippase [Spirochaetota bacterium]
MREAARVRDDRKKLGNLASELLVINLVFTIIAYAVLFIALIFSPQLRADARLIMLVSAGVFFASIGMEWMYQALEEYVYITLRSIFFQTAAMVLLFVFVRDSSDYLNYAALSAFSGIGANILNFVQLRSRIDFSFTRSLRFRRHIKPILVMFLMNVATSIYLNLNSVMLGFFSTKESVGYYSAAQKIVQMVILFVASLGTVLLPRSAYYIEKGRLDDFRRLVRSVISFVFMLGFPSVAGIMILRTEIIRTFAGDAFVRSADILAITAPSILVIGVSGIIGMQILIPMRKEKITMYSVMVGTIVNLVLNLFLIPRYAERGAAVSVLVAEIAVLAFQLVRGRKIIRGIFSVRRVLPYIAGSAALVTLVVVLHYFIHNDLTHLLVSIPLSAALYFGILYLFKDEMIMMILANLMKIKRRIFRRSI